MNQDLWFLLFEKLSFSEFSRLKQTCHYVESLCIDYESKLIESMYRKIIDESRKDRQGNQQLWIGLENEMKDLIFNSSSTLIQKWNNFHRIVDLLCLKNPLIDRLFCAQLATIDQIIKGGQKSLIRLIEYYFSIKAPEKPAHLIDPIVKKQCSNLCINKSIYNQFRQIPEYGFDDVGSNASNFDFVYIFESENRSIMQSIMTDEILKKSTDNHLEYDHKLNSHRLTHFCIHPQFFHERLMCIKENDLQERMGQDFFNLLDLPIVSIQLLDQNDAFLNFFMHVHPHHSYRNILEINSEQYFRFIDESKLKILLKHRKTFDRINRQCRVFYYGVIRELDNLNELNERMKILSKMNRSFIRNETDMIAFQIFCQPSSIINQRSKDLLSIKFFEGFANGIKVTLLLLPSDQVRKAAKIVNNFRQTIERELSKNRPSRYWKFIFVSILAFGDTCKLEKFNTKGKRLIQWLCNFASHCKSYNVFQVLQEQQPLNLNILIRSPFRNFVLGDRDSFLIKCELVFQMIQNQKNHSDIRQKIDFLKQRFRNFYSESLEEIVEIQYHRLTMMHLKTLATYFENHQPIMTHQGFIKLLNVLSFFQTNDNTLEKFLTQYFSQ